MTDPSHRRHVEIQADGQLTGIVDVERLESAPVVRAELHVESGHLPPGSRARLVDALLDSPEAARSERLEATIPLGDAEILERVRERCDGVETRAAGATSLVDAEMPTAHAAGHREPTDQN